MDLEILFEDNHLIAIHKKPSQIVQGDKTGDISLDQLVKDYLKRTCQKPGNVYLGVIHRIDRPVSGVVLFARTSKALSRMNNLFREGRVHKKYWAIVKEKPVQQEGELIHYLKKNEKQNKSYAFDKPVKGAKQAILSYSLLNQSDNYYLLEIQPQTGRHHQIRCQLSKMGCPIKGDLKYGFPRSNKDGSISLHARSIYFIHPVRKEEIQINAPVPEDSLWKEITHGLT